MVRRIKVESVSVSARVPRTILDEIENIVKEGFYMDVNDYLREIIRKDIQTRKLLKENPSLRASAVL